MTLKLTFHFRLETYLIFSGTKISSYKSSIKQIQGSTCSKVFKLSKRPYQSLFNFACKDKKLINEMKIKEESLSNYLRPIYHSKNPYTSSFKNDWCSTMCYILFNTLKNNQIEKDFLYKYTYNSLSKYIFWNCLVFDSQINVKPRLRYSFLVSSLDKEYLFRVDLKVLLSNNAPYKIFSHSGKFNPIPLDKYISLTELQQG